MRTGVRGGSTWPEEGPATVDEKNSPDLFTPLGVGCREANRQKAGSPFLSLLLISALVVASLVVLSKVL